MPYIRDSFFAGRQFASLTQMQGDALRWATQVYGVHKHRGLDGQTPAAVFTAVEADALIPLPGRPFETVVYTVGRVAPDCHVKSGKALYSVPWRLIGQSVTARTAGDVVQIFHTDTVVATHVLHLSGRSTNFQHYPPHKIAHTLRSVTWCRTQAAQTRRHPPRQQHFCHPYHGPPPHRRHERAKTPRNAAPPLRPPGPAPRRETRTPQIPPGAMRRRHPPPRHCLPRPASTPPPLRTT